MQSKLDKLKKRRDQLSEQIKDSEAREKTKSRKAETRKKIIFGGAALKWLDTKTKDRPELKTQLLNEIKECMSEKDRVLF